MEGWWAVILSLHSLRGEGQFSVLEGRLYTGAQWLRQLSYHRLTIAAASRYRKETPVTRLTQQSCCLHGDNDSEGHGLGVCVEDTPINQQEQPSTPLGMAKNQRKWNVSPSGAATYRKPSFSSQTREGQTLVLSGFILLHQAGQKW